jgi:UDP-glucose 4-epimerase
VPVELLDNNMKVLVAGGAGYIGSHMCRQLAEAGHECVVLDNLSTGHPEAVSWGQLEQGSLLRADTLDAVFSRHRPDAVMHFAALSIVADSARDPAGYYRNNVVGTLNLVDSMRRNGVTRLVFSSTASVYGEPQHPLVTEAHPLQPVSVYGATKLAAERLIADCCKAYGLHAVALRYFNAAGAEPENGIGEAHEPETHLIPNLLRSLVAGTELHVYGQDYPTRDGTCIRDYIHVTDLCRAHLLALERLGTDPAFDAINLGTGAGYSVREIIAAAAEVAGRQPRIREAPRRQGDPGTLVASNEKARRLLDWKPAITDIRQIIDSAWRWHRKPAY